MDVVDLTGRNVIVTRGAEGIGAAIAAAVDAKGPYVVIGGMRAADRTLEVIDAAGGRASATLSEISDAGAVKRLSPPRSNGAGASKVW